MNDCSSSYIRDIDILRCIVAPPLECLIRFGTRICIHTYIHVSTRRYAHAYVYTYTSVFTLSLAHCHHICRYPRCVLQWNSANHSRARTAMHVIMNARRLFVSVPSAGNIGHFEFSIFNALVSPFGPLLSWCPPALAPLFPAIPVAARSFLSLTPRPSHESDRSCITRRELRFSRGLPPGILVGGKRYSAKRKK